MPDKDAWNQGRVPDFLMDIRNTLMAIQLDLSNILDHLKKGAEEGWSRSSQGCDTYTPDEPDTHYGPKCPDCGKPKWFKPGYNTLTCVCNPNAPWHLPKDLIDTSQDDHDTTHTYGPFTTWYQSKHVNLDGFWYMHRTGLPQPCGKGRSLSIALADLQAKENYHA